MHQSITHAAAIRVKVNKQDDTNEEMIDIGGNAELKCRVVTTNHDDVEPHIIRSYKWFKVGKEEEVLSDQDKLVINPFKPDKAGMYGCKVAFKSSYNQWVPHRKVSTPYTLQTKGEYSIHQEYINKSV